MTVLRGMVGSPPNFHLAHDTQCLFRIGLPVTRVFAVPESEMFLSTWEDLPAVPRS